MANGTRIDDDGDLERALDKLATSAQLQVWRPAGQTRLTLTANGTPQKFSIMQMMRGWLGSSTTGTSGRCFLDSQPSIAVQIPARSSDEMSMGRRMASSLPHE